VTPAQTGPITAQDIVDQSGNPVGVQAFRGANGAVHPLRPQSITLEGRIRVLTASAAIIKSQIDASPSQAITESLLKKQANILAQLDDLLTKKEAIAPPRAADRTAVYKRLKEMGVTKGEPIRPVYQAPDEQPTEDQFDEQP
jgi:Fe2+ transport system protein FeoA